MIEFELKSGNKKNFGNGAFAVVIFEPEKEVATKVFHPSNGKSLEYVEKVFKSEVDAYRRIWEGKCELSRLQKITPKFHGVVEEPIKITHDLGESIDSNIPKELTSKFAFKMDYIPFQFIKTGSCRSSIERCLRANGFQQNSLGRVFGDLWTSDASVAIDGDKMWVIDFATEDWDNLRYNV